MPKTLIVALAGALLLVIFAIQNASEVLVKLFFWEFYSSLSLIIILCLVFGALVGSLLTVTSMRRKAKVRKSESPAAHKEVVTGNTTPAH